MLYSGKGHLEFISPACPAAAFDKSREVCSDDTHPSPVSLFHLKTVLELQPLYRNLKMKLGCWACGCVPETEPGLLFSAPGESCSLGRNTGDRELDPQKPCEDVGIPRGKDDGSRKQLPHSQLPLRSPHIFHLAGQLLLPHRGGGFPSCLFPSFLSLPHKAVSSFINQHLCLWHTLAGL